MVGWAQTHRNGAYLEFLNVSCGYESWRTAHGAQVVICMGGGGLHELTTGQPTQWLQEMGHSRPADGSVGVTMPSGCGVNLVVGGGDGHFPGVNNSSGRLLIRATSQQTTL
jgi:hypothetical protein